MTSANSKSQHHSLYGPKSVILLTNDDGIHPEDALILLLAQNLVANGHDVVVCAPGRNNSACGQRITADSRLTMRRHPHYEERYGSPHADLKVYSIDEGTPADCILIAVEPYHGLLAQLDVWPRLTISGINYGLNLASDVIYSGTFGAARQSAMYGIPSIASSVDIFISSPSDQTANDAIERAIDATVHLLDAVLEKLPNSPVDIGRIHPRRGLMSDVISRDASRPIHDRIGDAFARGDVVLNLNVPRHWEGAFKPTHLDGIFYRCGPRLPFPPTGLVGDEKETVCIEQKSASADSMESKKSDSLAIKSEFSSLTPVGTWPVSHPLALSETFFEDAVSHGLPNWLPINWSTPSIGKF